MSAIARKSSFFFITHICTFVIPPLFMLAGSLNNRAVLSVMALWIPVWLSSSVLWSERQEAYAFLRILPVTDRRIVRAKFGLALGFAAVYWLVMALFIRAAWGSTPEYDGYMAWATLASAAALVLAVGFVFANGLSLMANARQMLAIFDRTARSGAVSGLALNLGDPTLVPRTVFRGNLV